MPRSTASVANALLYHARQRGQTFDHIKVQKLVYFIHVWSLVLQGQSQLDERPEAWPHGPIFSSLFYRLEEIGTSRVKYALRELDPETGQFAYLMPAEEDEAFWTILRKVWSEYGSCSTRELSMLAHAIDSPWDRARAIKAVTVPDEFILDCYGPPSQEQETRSHDETTDCDTASRPTHAGEVVGEQRTFEEAL